MRRHQCSRCRRQKNNLLQLRDDWRPTLAVLMRRKKSKAARRVSPAQQACLVGGEVRPGDMQDRNGAPPSQYLTNFILFNASPFLATVKEVMLHWVDPRVGHVLMDRQICFWIEFSGHARSKNNDILIMTAL
jgi:hypothetical protein